MGFFALFLGHLLNLSSYSPLDKWQVFYNLNVIPFCETDRPKKSLTVHLIHKSNFENKSVLQSEREREGDIQRERGKESERE